MTEQEIREAVEASVLKLDPIEGINCLLEKVQPERVKRNELLKMKAKYLNAKKDYLDGLSGLKRFNKFKDKFNDHLLSMLDSVVTLSSDTTGPKLEAEEIELTKRQIMIRIYSGSSFNLLVFRTNYVMNRLFVENKFFGGARIMRKSHFWRFPIFLRKKIQSVDNVEILDSDLAPDTDQVDQDQVGQPLKILNLLGYHKRFPFVLRSEDQDRRYVLIVNFSLYSGLISNYTLTSEDKILLDSSL